MPQKPAIFIIKSLAAIALIGSIAWCIAQPSYEPTIAIVVSLSTFISVFVVENRRKKVPTQSQTVKKGIGIQAGGNVNIGSPDHNRNDHHAE